MTNCGGGTGTGKAGGSAELKLRACDRCASIKQVCDRGEHAAGCSRCNRLELPCAITRVHKPMGRPRKARSLSTSSASSHEHEHDETPVVAAATATGMVKPRRVQRTRSGCVTCKQRRKKCDELLPTCSDCRRLGLVCERPSSVSVAGTGTAGKAVVRVRRSSSASSGRRPHISPHATTLAQVQAHAHAHSNATSTFPHLLLSTLYTSCTPQEQHLLQHYTHVVSRSLSVVPDDLNAFITVFVPMALQQPALRYALLGLSATHLKRLHSSFASVATHYRQLAITQANLLLSSSSSSIAVSSADDSVTEGLAAILFLTLQSVCEGGSTSWSHHLEAAVTIINTRGGPAAFPPAVSFLLESVAYLDAIATLSLSKSAYLDQQFYLPAPSNAGAVRPHALFGTAHPLFAIIADISQLAQVRRACAPSAAFRELAAELEWQLQAWEPAACAPCGSDPELGGKVTAAAVMLQWAALLRLHLIVADEDDGKEGLRHPKVRTAVGNILAALATIPEGDLVESMLVFPVFAAGFAAGSREEVEVIRSRFGVMERSIGFGNVWDAHEICEVRWGRMEAAGMFDNEMEGEMGELGLEEMESVIAGMGGGGLGDMLAGEVGELGEGDLGGWVAEMQEAWWPNETGHQAVERPKMMGGGCGGWEAVIEEKGRTLIMG
ncbi:fungal-specific transcription factor domain-containing protein [Geopyxis carbonaria]|nr:fungal-specific transcription factor domain-containing protein [Geopyxis carbonaria]